MTDKVRDFIGKLSNLKLANCFNPYTDTCATFDDANAPMIRTENLHHILAAAEPGVDDLWIGLELGYNGGRRTGLAMTDDAHLKAHGRRFGIDDQLRRATKAGSERELTAGIVWQALDQIDRRIFLWNVVPIHPHRHREPLSNRRHTADERAACMPYLTALIEILTPRRLVSIGKDSEAALRERGYAPIPVRHPAFGGKRDFLDQITRIIP